MPETTRTTLAAFHHNSAARAAHRRGETVLRYRGVVVTYMAIHGRHGDYLMAGADGGEEWLKGHEEVEIEAIERDNDEAV